MLLFNIYTFLEKLVLEEDAAAQGTWEQGMILFSDYQEL